MKVTNTWRMLGSFIKYKVDSSRKGTARLLDI